MPKDPVVTLSIIEAMKRRGMNQSQIAEAIGVSRQYISYVKRKHSDYSRTPREQVQELYPWRTSTKHNGSALDRLLRDHAEYMLAGAKGLNREQIRRLQTFYNRIQTENLVVEFDPDIPPSKGNPNGGYAYRDREEQDGSLIIRVNSLATMPPGSHEIWRLPDTFPEIT